MNFINELVFAHGPWDYFEKAIARFLIHKGWENVEHVGGTGDKGADIIATKKGEDYVFQVKYSQSTNPLSVEIVDDVVRAMEFYRIDKGVCISNRVLGPTQSRKIQTYKDSGYQINSFTADTLLRAVEKMDIWINDLREPYNYQKECIQELKAVYPRNRKGLISLATGMGKTYVACSFVRWLYKKHPNLNILVLAHTEPLLTQFEKSLWISLPKFIPTHILSGSSKPNFTGGVLLSTFGSFENWYKKNDDLRIDIVIVDEDHHSRAPTFERTINSVRPNFILGLTATPFRSDGASVTDMFGAPLVHYDVKKGIKKKYLKEVSYKLMNDNIDKQWVIENSKKGYSIKNLNKKLFIPQRDEEICSIFMEYWNSENR
jgi:superfamily II DNA or RNA helicase